MCLSVKMHRPEHCLEEGEYKGYKYVIMNNGSAYRCGYIRIPVGHPLHGKDDDCILDCHGGITFAEADVPCDKGGADNAWWLGFDAAHYSDAPDPDLDGYQGSSVFSGIFGIPGEISSVKDQDYVRSECHSMIDQAIAVQEKGDRQ